MKVLLSTRGYTIISRCYRQLELKLMTIEYATVKAKGQVVIPVDIRRKFQIDEGTRVAFLEEEGRLFLQPVTDEFIEEMKGIAAGSDLPASIERDPDRNLR